VPSVPQIHQHPSALACWQGRGHAMPSAHRHDDLEVNLVDDEPLTYLFGGSLVTVEPGHTALFWASVPHRLTVGRLLHRAPPPGRVEARARSLSHIDRGASAQRRRRAQVGRGRRPPA
jgi:hypothetical protein